MLQFLSVPLEIKSDHLKDGQFEGHGSVFGNVDLQNDVIVAGAFSDTLKEHKEKGQLPQMFWMHQPDQVPGKWLHMNEDSKGLHVIGQLLPTTLGKDMHILLKAKAVRGLSVGFMVREESFSKDGVRMITNIDLWETSLVSLAANPLAEVESAKARLSSSGEFVPTLRQFERDLRDQLGYTRKVAAETAAKVFAGRDGNHEQQWDTDEDMVRLGRLLHQRRGMDRPAATLFE